MLKGLGNLKEIMSQAKDVQKNINEMQEKAASLRITSTVGAGMISVVATGDQKILDIKINRELFDPRDVDMLEELIISGVNDALEKAKAAVAEQIKDMSKGFNFEELQKQFKESLDPKNTDSENPDSKSK